MISVFIFVFLWCVRKQITERQGTAMYYQSIDRSKLGTLRAESFVNRQWVRTSKECEDKINTHLSNNLTHSGCSCRLTSFFGGTMFRVKPVVFLQKISAPSLPTLLSNHRMNESHTYFEQLQWLWSLGLGSLDYIQLDILDGLRKVMYCLAVWVSDLVELDRNSRFLWPVDEELSLSVIQFNSKVWLKCCPIWKHTNGSIGFLKMR